MNPSDEILAIFRSDAQKHLENLQGLLWRDEAPDEETLSHILRLVHTLKGDARMVGLETVGEVCHHLEDLLKGLQAEVVHWDKSFSTLVFEVLGLLESMIFQTEGGSQGWEQLQEKIREKLGQKSSKKSSTLKKKLTRIFQKAPPTSSMSSPPKVAEREGDSKREPSKQVASEASPATKKSEDPSEVSDFVRVRTSSLDSILNLVGELSINREKITSIFYRLRNALSPLWDDLQSSTPKELNTGLLKEVLQEFQEGVSEYFHLSSELQAAALDMRMLPFQTLFQEYPALVEKISQQLGKEVRLIIEGGDTLLDKHILESLRPAFLHLIRNAIDHGIESPEERRAQGKPPYGTIHLRGYLEGRQVVVEICDDGRGLDEAKIRQKALERGILPAEKIDQLERQELLNLIFTPGFSTKEITTQISGRGIGMDVVHAVVDQLRGYIRIESEPGRFTRFQIQLPITHSLMRVVLVAVEDQVVAIPLNFVEEVVSLDTEALPLQGNYTVFQFRGMYIPLFSLAHLLGFSQDNTLRESFTILILSFQKSKIGLLVDRVLREQEVVVKGIASLPHLPYTVGATILRHGDPATILNVYDVFHRLQYQQILETPLPRQPLKRKKVEILVVDDSITVRTIQKAVLEKAGYHVDTAVSGRDAWEKTRKKRYHVVITDIQMDDMDGFELTQKLRQDERYKHVPIIMVTSLANEADRKKGLELGAQRYIVKSSYNQRELVETVRSLIGESG